WPTQPLAGRQRGHSTLVLQFPNHVPVDGKAFRGQRVEGCWVERKDFWKGLAVGGPLSSGRSVHYRNARGQPQGTGGMRNPNGSAVEQPPPPPASGGRGPPPRRLFPAAAEARTRAPTTRRRRPAPPSG